jgi:PAS domain S-box-containing protein
MERFEVLFESNPHPTWVYDLETLRFLEVNQAAIRKYGYSREEFLSMRITDIRPEEDAKQLLEDLKKERPAFQSAEKRHRARDGQVLPVEVTSNVADLHGRRVAVVVAEDVTQRREAHRILVKSKEDAEQATRFKDQFLSTMSHELRTPLNAILGFSELITDERYGALNERQRRYIDHISTSGKHLLRLINDLLDLSKIQSGRFELALENVSIETALGEVISAVRPLADRKAQTLACDVEKKHLTVRADATRLKQVLFNIVGNAIKFTPDGGRIQLRASAADDRVSIEVCDDGPGIPAEEQQRIFEPFYLLRAAGDVKEGSGLGLAISQRLVELHGGQLGLRSTLGQGSCFFFSLPAGEGAVTSAEPVENIMRNPKSAPLVLVVEDDPATLQLISSQLTSAGYEVAPCTDPTKACDLAAYFQPDAITLDLFMKPMSGWEVLVELKGKQATEQIPVIVLTVIEQPNMGAILGADEYLVKPVEKAVFLAAVERCLKSRGGSAPKQPILVVEDHAPTREIILDLLHTNGYGAHAVSDGCSAREFVGKALPGLVVLDLLLPDATGFDLIAEWRGDPRTAEIPIFVLTSKDLSQDETKYLRANAEFLVHKQEDWRAALLKRMQRAIPQPQMELL